MKFDILNRYLNKNRSYRWNWASIKLDINYTSFRDINSWIFDIFCISHKLSITNYKIFGYTGVNYNLIKFVRQVLASSNIDKKIYIDYIISSIGGVDIIG